MGFSLNNLTLFGLVLAIGIVVDDAIVVVEAVEHHIEHGLAPRDATIKAMEQVSGPVIAVGLVLQRGVRAVRVHHRHHRAVLPAVRPDDRRLDADLGVQLADAQPGAGGAAAAAARQGHGAAAAVAGVRRSPAAGWAGSSCTPWLADGWIDLPADLRPRPCRWLVAVAGAAVAGWLVQLAAQPRARAGSSAPSTAASTLHRPVYTWTRRPAAARQRAGAAWSTAGCCT